MFMKKLLDFFVFVSLILLLGCAKDNIVLIDPIETDDSEDLIANTVFTQTVSVVFSTDGNATVTGTNEDFTVSVSGNDVTLVYSGEEYVMYELSGIANDGFFKLYSAKNLVWVVHVELVVRHDGELVPQLMLEVRLLSAVGVHARHYGDYGLSTSLTLLAILNLDAVIYHLLYCPAVLAQSERFTL